MTDPRLIAIYALRALCFVSACVVIGVALAMIKVFA